MTRLCLFVLSCILALELTVSSPVTCDVGKLGMGDGTIPDSHITASSSSPGYEAYNGRFNRDEKFGAWCPDKSITRNSYEWLQIDFQEMVNISHILVAGLFNDGSGTRFTRKFKVHYQRTEGEQWRRYKIGAEEVFAGVTQARDTNFLALTPPLLASRVRVIPYTELTEDVCLRVEFYGCQLNGVATYSIPPGDSRGSRFALIDKTYDGNSATTGFMGGLGQLTDQVLANSNYLISDGYGWVGWLKDNHGESVTLLFEMDHSRNISRVKIHTNNQYSKDIRVFRRAQIFTSVDGAYYTRNPIVDKTFDRLAAEESKIVSINLPDNTIAKFVKIVLMFDDKWLLISEVTFVSELHAGEITVPTTTVSTPEPTTVFIKPTNKATAVTETPDTNTAQTSPPDETTKPAKSNFNDNAKDESVRENKVDGTMIGIIVGACTAVILVVLAVMITCCLYKSRHKSATPSRQSYPGEGNSFNPGLKSYNGLSNCDSERGDCSDYDQPLSTRPLPPRPNGTLQSSGYASDGAQYACIPVDSHQNFYGGPQAHPHHISNGFLPPPCQQCFNNGLLTMPNAMMNRTNIMSRANNTLPPNGILQSPCTKDSNSYEIVQPDTSPYDSSNYRSTPSAPPINIQGTSGTSVYGTQLLLPAKQLEEELPIIAKSCLKFIEKLGAGQYGEVHLCELRSGPSKRTSEIGRLVAVKTLQANANEQAQSDFNREIRIMNRLRHDNIVQVLGLCPVTNSTDSIAVVTEYMSRGDLHQFLQKSAPEGANMPGKHSLSHSCLLNIAAQIARGMSYLEQLHITHRDLAARNCLVGEGFQVKISDFGMSRNLYSQQYYKVEGRVVLPIRWMAWESVLLGRFTTKSDVWSFGVTLWEIFMFAREQPFSSLSDDQVITNCMNYYANNLTDTVVLQQPSYCTKEVYDLMQACCGHIDTNRPSFKDITTFLQRKTPQHSKTDSDSSMTRLTTC